MNDPDFINDYGDESDEYEVDLSEEDLEVVEADIRQKTLDIMQNKMAGANKVKKQRKRDAKKEGKDANR